jgi:hypothetical protein
VRFPWVASYLVSATYRERPGYFARWLRCRAGSVDRGKEPRGPSGPAMMPTQPPCGGYLSRPTVSQVHPTGTFL